MSIVNQTKGKHNTMETASFNRVLRSSNNVNTDYQSKHSSRGASFIKLLGPHDVSNQLEIPNAFTNIFNEEVPHRFIIENAITNKCSRVEVEKKEDGSTYFSQGWADFMETHSLQVGYFLLFEYEEHSILQVKIYDRNGCQIIPLDPQGGKNNPLKIIDFDKSAREPSQPITHCNASECEPEILGIISPNTPKPQKTRGLSARKYGNSIYKKKPAILRKNLRTARVSLTGNSVSFSVKIHKYKTHQFRELTIPKEISVAKNLMSKDKLILENVKGNRWTVTLLRRTDGRLVLFREWKDFFKANQVSAGDTLTLEFVTDDLAQVRVTKASQALVMSEDEQAGESDMECEVDDVNEYTSNDNSGGSIRTKRSRKKFSSEDTSSSFSFLWRPTTAGFYLHVPKFVKEAKKLREKDNVAIRDEQGKCWPLEVGIRRDGRVALTKGWVEFWKGHDIKPGDSMDFEFVSDYLIQAKINRGEIVNFTITDDEEPETVAIQSESD